MSNNQTVTLSNITSGPFIGQTLTVNNGGPFGSSGTLVLTNNTNEHEQLSIEDLRRFKEMCGLMDYIASVDPKFKEYMTAYRAKQRILR